jgi:RimJ/RimL family protein N-acetyltransferase
MVFRVEFLMFPEITHDDVFRLETKRMWLRWPCAGDADAFVSSLSNPDLTLKTTIPHPYQSKHAEDFISSARNHNACGDGLFLALSLKGAPNDAIGMISVSGASIRGTTRLGFWLTKSFWGQGLMSEAANAFVDLIFKISSLDHIESCVSSDNHPSMRILIKLGFVQSGETEIYTAARDTKMNMVVTRLKRGSAHTVFGARRPKLIST